MRRSRRRRNAWSQRGRRARESHPLEEDLDAFLPALRHTGTPEPQRAKRAPRPLRAGAVRASVRGRADRALELRAADRGNSRNVLRQAVRAERGQSVNGGELLRCCVDGCEWMHFSPFHQTNAYTLADVFGAGVMLAVHGSERKHRIEQALAKHFATHSDLEWVRTITRLQALTEIQPDWAPTPETINKLPAPLRRYIHDLETNADPAGMVRENVLLRDQVEVCQLMLQERGVRA